MKCVFLDRSTLDRDDLDLSALEGLVSEWVTYETTIAGEVVERIHDAQVVITNKVVIDDGLMAQAPGLKLIAVAATGTNNVDVAAAESRDITVCNIRDYAGPTVTEHVFALLLNLCRQLPRYSRAVRQGRWQESDQFCLLDFPIRELSAMTMGIVGYGRLGQQVAHTAHHGFGMQVLLAESFRGGGGDEDSEYPRLPLHELLPQVDVLSLHCPLSQQTRGLIGRDELSRMRPDAYLINTARGGVVDEKALIEALHERRLGGAGFDVLSQEPPGPDHPMLDASIPNLILTPHIAWASHQARQRLVDKLAENLTAFISGKPINTVTEE